MNRERTRLLRYLTVILLLVIAVGVAGYFILQPKTMVGGPYPWRPGWKTIAVRDLRLKLVDVWSAEAPPAIVAASKNTQLAWILLDACRYWPDTKGRPKAMLDPYWRSHWGGEVLLGPDHPFTRLVALGKDAVPACIELLRPGTGPIRFEHEAAFLDLVLTCALTGRDWRDVVLGTSRRRSAFPDASQLKDTDPMVKWSVEGAAWVKWYDGGMKTPLPPLIQYQLDHPIGEHPEYYDQFGRPRHMDPEDLEGLPLPSGPVPEKDEEGHEKAGT